MFDIVKVVLGICLVEFGIAIVKLTPINLALICGVLGLICQIAYGRRLNSYLGGADPAKYGYLSFKELKAAMPVPFVIKALKYAATTFGIAVVVSILTAVV